jgi:hypothetical protein
MVRCGEGNTGICMSGYFATDPFKFPRHYSRGNRGIEEKRR